MYFVCVGHFLWNLSRKVFQIVAAKGARGKMLLNLVAKVEVRSKTVWSDRQEVSE